MDQCTKCGSSKRQSTFSLSSQEPSLKRATLHPSFSPTTTTTIFSDDHHLVHGFTKLPLPFPALRRCSSDVINSPGAKNVSDGSNSMANNFLNHQLQPLENSTVNSVATSPSAPLQRSISDPTSGSLPPEARKVMQSSCVGDAAGLNLKEESPNTKRLKRMKDRLREMSQWWNEVIKEGEERSDSEDDDKLPKDEPEVSQVTDESEETCQEAVWVERNGECLILHFKCPCGEGYQVLLSGKNCYYKLTNF